MTSGPPTHATCCTDVPDEQHVGTAWGRLLTAARREGAPQPVSTHAVDWVLQLELGATTCVCAEACNCATLDDNVRTVLAMTEAALRGLSCCHEGQACAPPVEVLGLTAVGPEGDCAGFIATVQVGVGVCCPGPDGKCR